MPRTPHFGRGSGIDAPPPPHPLAPAAAGARGAPAGPSGPGYANRGGSALPPQLGFHPPAAGNHAAAIQRVLVIQDKLNIASAVNCCGHHPAGDLYLHLMWQIFFFFHCPCSCWQSHELWRHLITRSAARFLTLWVFVAVNKNTRFNKWVTFPVSAHV